MKYWIYEDENHTYPWHNGDKVFHLTMIFCGPTKPEKFFINRKRLTPTEGSWKEWKFDWDLITPDSPVESYSLVAREIDIEDVKKIIRLRKES